MKKIKTNLTRAVTALLLCFGFNSFAQTEAAAIDNFFTHTFNSDSLDGFDEQATSAAAVTNGCYGLEFKVFMNRAKRQYINKKYNITVAAPSLPFVNDPIVMPAKIAAKGASLPSSGACSNEDFEDATANAGPQAGGVVNGWDIFGGTGADFCVTPFVTGATNNYTVFNGPVGDPFMGAVSASIVTSYFDAISNIQPAGACFIRLNNASSGAKVIRLSKTYTISASNALFQYAYRAVLNDPNHSCCDQPGFKIRVTLTNTATSTSTVLACPQVSTAAGSACGNQPGSPTFSLGTGGYRYNPNWVPSSIDLSANIGNAVTLDVFAIDCSLGGHAGYVYFDAKCSPMTIIGNGNAFPAGTPSINIPTCGAAGATITLPSGLGPYSWQGPFNSVPPPYTVPNFTNQVFQTNVSGQYTVTMNPAGSCVPITKTLNVVITPAPQLVSSIIQPGCTSTLAIASCTAAGSASVNPTILWSPTPLSLNVTSTTATYNTPGTVTITATDGNNCPITNTLIVLPPPPPVTFSVLNTSNSNSITCKNPTVTLVPATSYTYGTLTYTWSSLSLSTTASSVAITQPQTLTVAALDAATNCSATTVFTVPINIIPPTSSASPSLQSITCGPGAIVTFTGTALTPTSGGTFCHFWFSPNGGPMPACIPGTISIYANSTPGTHTFVLENTVNGCTVAKTVTITSSLGFPTYSITSNTNFTVGCAPRNTTTISAVGAVSTPTAGAPMSYTYLPPGFTGTNYATTPIPSTVITIPGTYTLVVRDGNNQCESRSNITILQNTVSPHSLITALSQTQTIFALNCYTPNITALGSSTTANTSVAWVTPSGTQIPQSSISISSTTNPAITNLGTYSLVVTDASNACITIQPFPITQSIRIPTIGVIRSTAPSSITCYGTPVVLNFTAVTSPTGAPVSAIGWVAPSPQLPGTGSSFNAGVAGVYTVTVRDLNNGCLGIGTTTVTENTTPPILNSPNAPPPFILDCGAQSVRVAPIVSNTLAAYTYSWAANDPLNSQGITPSFTIGSPFTNVTRIGEYRVIVTNTINGCQATAEIEVINGTLTAGMVANPTSGYSPLTVSFNNTSSSSGSIAPTASITSNWSFGNGIIQTTTTNITTSTVYQQAGTYLVTLIATKGSCVDSVSQVISVDIGSKLTVPNVFTPNGDGSNDKFFLLTQNLTNIDARIYDRWGNLVFEMISEKGNIEWDGKNQYGRESASGTYFYIIKAKGKDDKEFEEKGTISLYR